MPLATSLVRHHLATRRQRRTLRRRSNCWPRVRGLADMEDSSPVKSGVCLTPTFHLSQVGVGMFSIK